MRTTVVIRNNAPITGTPSYQLGPVTTFTAKPGDYLAWILLWGPSGSTQLYNSVGESGLNLSNFVMAVPAGEERELTFETVLRDAVRDGRFNLRLVPQPRLEPVPLAVTLRTEGRVVGGAPTSWQGVGDRVHNLSWTIGA